MWLKTWFVGTLNYLVVYPETPLFFRVLSGYFCTIFANMQLTKFSWSGFELLACWHQPGLLVPALAHSLQMVKMVKMV